MEASATLDDMLASALAAAKPHGKFETLPQPPPGRMLVLGGGKGGAAMAAAFGAAWGQPLAGLVVVPYGHMAENLPDGVEVVEAAHPVPDVAGQAAAARMLELARAATEDDHVVFLGSGGCSSLLALPAAGITLEEKRAVNKDLLRAGAVINDLNTVRRALSAIKGGRLAAACAPAPVTSYLISDVPGDDPAVIGSGPTIPQVSRADEALQVLDHHQVSVPEHVVTAMQANEVTVAGPGGDVHVIVRPQEALAAAAAVATAAGYRVVDLGDRVEGEAREVGAGMARQAQAIAVSDQPTAIISGGELTVSVAGDGSGGSNHEFLLGLALALEGHAGIQALAVDTDGKDGNAPAAGARVTPDTLARARVAGLDPAAMLATNDAHGFFAALGDTIVTGPTCTNVNDFRVVLVDAPGPG